MLILLSASLFLTTPAPLEMPRADAYLVKVDGRRRLEDRFDVMDLWTSQTVEGRWIDDDGRVFMLSRLEYRAPSVRDGVTSTRADARAGRVRLDKRDKDGLVDAIGLLSPVDLPEVPLTPRQMPRGYRDVDYWQGTNTSAIVCSFLPEKGDVWYLASWLLAEGDDLPDSIRAFEEEFLVKEFPKRFDFKAKTREPKRIPSERELLRADARHSVSNYPTWHWTDSVEYAVLDDLSVRRDFIDGVTNALASVRREFDETMPNVLDGTNVLCVARIFATRDEFLEAAGEDMSWSAAFWNPSRRELVACLPPVGGQAELMKTLRHEAFHQCLSYATSMISASPWFNEGYAQYFEDPSDDRFEYASSVELLAPLLPAVMKMNLEQFYAGSDDERHLRYRLAWSIVWFLEKGADKVRFQPFKEVKRDYFMTLLATKDPIAATAAAFQSSDLLVKFCDEWVRYWKER